MVLLVGLSRRFQGTDTQSLHLGKIVTSTVQRTATLRAKDSGLVWRGPEFLRELLALNNLEPLTPDGRNGNEGGALSLSALRAMTHGDFINLPVVLILNPAAQAATFVQSITPDPVRDWGKLT